MLPLPHGAESSLRRGKHRDGEGKEEREREEMPREGELTLAEGIDFKPGHFLGQDGFWQVEEGRVVDREIVVIVLQDPDGRSLDAVGRHSRAQGGTESRLAPCRGQGGTRSGAGPGWGTWTTRGTAGTGQPPSSSSGQSRVPQREAAWAQWLVNARVHVHTRVCAHRNAHGLMCVHTDELHGWA